MDMSQLALPKPEPRADVKARTSRVEKRHADLVRAAVLRRDQDCRATGVHVACYGPLQWCHMEGKRRHQTRAQAAQDRHDAAWTLALCQRHGDLEERHVIRVVYLSAKDCNGPVAWTVAA